MKELLNEMLARATKIANLEAKAEKGFSSGKIESMRNEYRSIIFATLCNYEELENISDDYQDILLAQRDVYEKAKALRQACWDIAEFLESGYKLYDMLGITEKEIREVADIAGSVLAMIERTVMKSE